jgi:hypothetical protein
MNRGQIITFLSLTALFVLGWCLTAGTMAQTLEKAPPLPAGMTGSDTNDPRAKLSPGLYDAGETSLGMKHIMLLKKPDAFQLGSDNPDDPKVQKTLGLLGVGDSSQIPKPLQLMFAQLAFANSDLAFQGNHLFQGNFYGVSIYDISDPAKLP